MSWIKILVITVLKTVDCCFQVRGVVELIPRTDHSIRVKIVALLAVGDNLSAHSLAVAVHRLDCDWRAVPADNVDVFLDFELLNAVTACPPVYQCGALSIRVTCWGSELQVRSNVRRVQLPLQMSVSGRLLRPMCITLHLSKFSFISHLSVQLTIATRSVCSLSQSVSFVKSAMILLPSAYNLHGKFSTTDGRS